MALPSLKLAMLRGEFGCRVMHRGATRLLRLSTQLIGRCFSVRRAPVSRSFRCAAPRQRRRPMSDVISGDAMVTWTSAVFPPTLCTVVVLLNAPGERGNVFST